MIDVPKLAPWSYEGRRPQVNDWKTVSRILLSGLLLILTQPALAAPQLPLPDDLARWRTSALIERIDADLLASTSATLTLERWCADHAIASPARILVERDKAANQAPDARQRGLLTIAADMPVRLSQGAAQMRRPHPLRSGELVCA